MKKVIQLSFFAAFSIGLISAAQAQAVSSGIISGPNHKKHFSHAVVRAPHSETRPSAVASRRPRSNDLVTGSIAKKPR
jgi:hypothetical protein